MGILDRRKPKPVLIRPISQTEAIVVATPDVIERFGEPREAIPSGLVRAVGTSMPLAKTAIESLSGRIVRLSEESIRLLRTNEVVPKDGLVSGVVRDAKTGQFAGLLNFERVDLATTALTSLPALLQGVALQVQLARIEKRLERIAGAVDYVIKQLHIEVEAGLVHAVDKLEDIAADSLESGFVDDDSARRLYEVEDEIKTLRARTTRNLMLFASTIPTVDLPIGQRVKKLRRGLETDRAAWWLQARIAAEIALLKWEQLHLIRAAWSKPDQLATISLRVHTNVLDRRRELDEIRTLLSQWQEEGLESERIIDQLRVVQRWRLKRLVSQIPAMLETYAPVMPYPAPELQAPIFEQLEAT